MIQIIKIHAENLYKAFRMECWKIIGFLILGILAAIYIYPNDSELLFKIQNWYEGNASLPKILSRFGQFEYSTIALSAGLYFVYKRTGKEMWLKSFKACLIAGLVSGILVSILRPAMGRARPYSDAEPGFYFMEGRHAFHSMPSGHVTTTSASLFAVGLVCPPLLPVAVIGVTGMAWTRLELNKHYPSDVIMAAALGFSVAWVSRKSIQLKTS